LLAGFATQVSVDETGIRDVRFSPLGLPLENDLLTLRGLAAEATRAGVLRFEGGEEERRSAALQFAGTVRMGKGYDPTLGLFAAYAYANALIPEGAASVRDILNEELKIELFDVALLAGALTQGCPPRGYVPPFPMLRQGWELLGPKRVELPGVAELRPYLLESLWTTFSPGGAETLLTLAESGGLRQC
jgi:hypothetical protein